MSLIIRTAVLAALAGVTARAAGRQPRVIAGSTARGRECERQATNRHYEHPEFRTQARMVHDVSQARDCKRAAY